MFNDQWGEKTIEILSMYDRSVLALQRHDDQMLVYTSLSIMNLPILFTSSMFPLLLSTQTIMHSSSPRLDDDEVLLICLSRNILPPIFLEVQLTLQVHIHLTLFAGLAAHLFDTLNCSNMSALARGEEYRV